MLVSEKIKEKEFKALRIKDAYMECCKWLSTNVLAVNNSNHITYKMYKKNKDGVRSIVLELYVTVDESDVHQKHCEICKEVTGSFFMKQNKHMCESCKVVPYRQRIENRIKAIKEGLKGEIL